MFGLRAAVRVYLAREPADRRKSSDGLAALVAGTLALDPLSGHLFVFINADFRGRVRNQLFRLALASWCADLAIKPPGESGPATVDPATHERDATRRVHRCVAPLPGQLRPAPLAATNSSHGACNGPTPPSR